MEARESMLLVLRSGLSRCHIYWGFLGVEVSAELSPLWKTKAKLSKNWRCIDYFQHIEGSSLMRIRDEPSPNLTLPLASPYYFRGRRHIFIFFSDVGIGWYFVIPHGGVRGCGQPTEHQLHRLVSWTHCRHDSSSNFWGI